jgi:hypothetical protein
MTDEGAESDDDAGGQGSATPNPTNRLAKIGTTHLSRAPTISTASETTATG